VDRVREVALGAFSHQDLPFERLVEELAPDRDLSRNPLVQVGFSLENAGGAGSWSLPGTEISDFEIGRAESKFDLFCGLEERPDGSLRGELTFSTELFDRGTVERLAGHLVRVLEAVVADPSVPVGSVDLLSPEERREILGGFNDTTVPFADDVTVHRLVELQAARTLWRWSAVRSGCPTGS
jgi:non-ribosomal peptide synthetase component F